MLLRILSWLTSRRLGSRRLFRYWDGRRWRYGDPFLLWRAIMNHPTVHFENALPLVDDGVEPETSQVVVALYEIFAVEPWDEHRRTGLTQWEILAVLGAFNLYLELLKKSTSPGPTSSPATASTPVAASAESPAPAPSSSWDSGSMPSESTPGGDCSGSSPSAIT
jgi:hypothetical protein